MGFDISIFMDSYFSQAAALWRSFGFPYRFAQRSNNQMAIESIWADSRAVSGHTSKQIKKAMWNVITKALTKAITKFKDQTP